MANLTNSSISGSIVETRGVGSISGTTITVDLFTGTFFELDLADATGDIKTITINSIPSSAVSTFTLKLKQGFTNIRQIDWTFAGAFSWPESSGVPTLSPAYERFNILSFTTYDKGETWHGTNEGEFPRTFPELILGDRALFAGGYVSPSNTADINYVSIPVPQATASDFGDLTSARMSRNSATSDGSRGVFGGNGIMDYVTIGTVGVNAATFGNYSIVRYGASATSGGGRGIFAGGYGDGIYRDVIDYITIATTGTANDFGNLITGGEYPPQGILYTGACSDGTRGIIGGGMKQNTFYNSVQYITIATLGNANNFGDLTLARDRVSAISNADRGVYIGGRYSVSGGDQVTNTMDYITIATLGNAADFGNLTAARQALACASSKIRALMAGGDFGNNSRTNAIDYITVATSSHAADFGDLTTQRDGAQGTSGD